MRQFIVPQFIKVEDKILGPITIRQFIIIVVGVVIDFVCLKLADFGFFVFLTLIITALVFLFGFLKINGSPFHNFLLHVIETFKKPRLRVWNRNVTDREFYLSQQKKVNKESEENVQIKKEVSKSRLAELSLVVDTHGKYKGEGKVGGYN